LGGLGSIGEAPFGLNPFQTAGFLRAPTGEAGSAVPLQPGLALPK
jgi:hypothetical protein